jgi:hypothetical protein
MGTYNLVCNSGVVTEGEKVILMIGFENHRSIGFNVDMISLPVRCVYLGYGNFKVEEDEPNFNFLINSLKDNFDFVLTDDNPLSRFEIIINDLKEIVFNANSERFNKKDFKVVVFHESYFETVKSLGFDNLFGKINCFTKTYKELFELFKINELETEEERLLKNIKIDFVWYSLEEKISSYLGQDYLRLKIKQIQECYYKKTDFNLTKLIGFLEIIHFNAFFNETGLTMNSIKIVNVSNRVVSMHNIHHVICLEHCVSKYEDPDFNFLEAF